MNNNNIFKTNKNLYRFNYKKVFNTNENISTAYDIFLNSFNKSEYIHLRLGFLRYKLYFIILILQLILYGFYIKTINTLSQYSYINELLQDIYAVRAIQVFLVGVTHFKWLPWTYFGFYSFLCSMENLAEYLEDATVSLDVQQNRKEWFEHFNTFFFSLSRHKRIPKFLILRGHEGVAGVFAGGPKGGGPQRKFWLYGAVAYVVGDTMYRMYDSKLRHTTDLEKNRQNIQADLEKNRRAWDAYNQDVNTWNKKSVWTRGPKPTPPNKE
jgi:hypothetical protein